MLEEAHRLKKAGVDVVIGWIEPHGGTKPPTSSATWKSSRAKESRTRAARWRFSTLKKFSTVTQRLRRGRAPFSNVAGSTNPKRYLDVQELLQAGINVITAMNIQHLESLHDTVLRATGVTCASACRPLRAGGRQIVNIDLPSEELRERLRQGKIYPTDRTAAALGNFFTENN